MHESSVQGVSPRDEFEKRVKKTVDDFLDDALGPVVPPDWTEGRLPAGHRAVAYVAEVLARCAPGRHRLRHPGDAIPLAREAVGALFFVPEGVHLARQVLGTTTNEPSPIDLVRELRTALGLFAGAMPVSPKQAWQEALAEVHNLRHGGVDRLCARGQDCTTCVVPS